jgi:hypothetical protein
VSGGAESHTAATRHALTAVTISRVLTGENDKATLIYYFVSLTTACS